MKKLITFFLLFISGHTCIAAIDLPKPQPVPGGFTVLALGKISDFKTAPKVFFRSHRTMVILQKGQWWTLVGIPITAKPGKTQISIESDRTHSEKTFLVLPKTYPVQQHLFFKEKNYVSPDKLTTKRIFDDNEKMQDALAHWTDQSPHELHFAWPTHGKISSVFGLRRILNGVPKSAHQGIDIAAPQGTKVVAATDGTVTNIGNYFLTGNTIVIDHGQSFMTIYCHLAKVIVKPHQTVKQGQLIGLVGKTGRATGPHLHFGVSLNDVRVNPTLFLSNSRTFQDVRSIPSWHQKSKYY